MANQADWWKNDDDYTDHVNHNDDHGDDGYDVDDYEKDTQSTIKKWQTKVCGGKMIHC